LNPLQSRKQLLLAESELNRVQVAGDLAAFKTGIQKLKDRAKSFESIASSAAVLVAGLTAFRRGASTNVSPKKSWLQIALKGAGLVSTLWLAFRPQTAPGTRPDSQNPRVG